jgi:excisionase family DNA binding protein
MEHEDAQRSTLAAGTPTLATVALLYLRAEQVLQLLPISRRCLSNWQRARRIKFYRVGRTVLFKRIDIESALEKFAVATIGERPVRKPHAKTVTASPPSSGRKRKMERVAA